MRSSPSEARYGKSIPWRGLARAGLAGLVLATGSCSTPEKHTGPTHNATADSAVEPPKPKYDSLEDLIGKPTILETPFLLEGRLITFHRDGSISIDEQMDRCETVIVNKGQVNAEGLSIQETHNVEEKLALGGTNVTYDGETFVFSSFYVGSGKIPTENIKDLITELSTATPNDDVTEVRAECGIEPSSGAQIGAMLFGSNIPETADCTFVFRRVEEGERIERGNDVDVAQDDINNPPEVPTAQMSEEEAEAYAKAAIESMRRIFGKN